MNRVRLFASLIALATLAGCSSGGDAPAGPSSGGAVEVTGFRFQPEEVAVAVGGSVTWTNTDDILHTITGGEPGVADPASMDGTLDGPSSTYTATFATAGTYPYFCARHESMRGSVIAS